MIAPLLWCLTLISYDDWPACGSPLDLWPPGESREGRSSGVSGPKTGAISCAPDTIWWPGYRVLLLFSCQGGQELISPFCASVFSSEPWENTLVTVSEAKDEEAMKNLRGEQGFPLQRRNCSLGLRLHSRLPCARALGSPQPGWGEH